MPRGVRATARPPYEISLHAIQALKDHSTILQHNCDLPIERCSVMRYHCQFSLFA
jgi:hypothetical protein